jgi:hypothetical protein
LNKKQDTLVSGTNIKTVNGESLLGEGDIVINGETDMSNYYTKEEANTALNSKANNDSVLHIAGEETITGVKTFNGRVNFLGSGDSNAMYLSTNTRLNVNGTTNTVLGFSSGTFLINNAAYNLTLRGKGTRPTYNNTTLALSSDIPAAVTENTISGWGFTKNTGTYNKPSTGIPKTDLASAIQTSLEKADTALQTETYKGTITGVSANGTSIATSGVANIPAASTSAYGVTKLSSATNSTSTSLAATASAVKAAYDLANGKQDKLVSGTNIKTINGTSILGSGDIVISGGGSSSGNGAYALVEHGTNDTTFTLTPNTFHVWGEVGSLTLTLGEEQSGVANEFLFQFESGKTATTLTLPDDLIWANDDIPVIESKCTYQISILNNLATIMKFKKPIVIISFIIGTGTFQAEEGMTWGDWVNSGYNINNSRVSNNNIFTGTTIITTQNNNPVVINDTIISNYNYSYMNLSGGAD